MCVCHCIVFFTCGDLLPALCTVVTHKFGFDNGRSVKGKKKVKILSATLVLGNLLFKIMKLKYYLFAFGERLAINLDHSFLLHRFRFVYGSFHGQCYFRYYARHTPFHFTDRSKEVRSHGQIFSLWCASSLFNTFACVHIASHSDRVSSQSTVTGNKNEPSQ